MREERIQRALRAGPPFRPMPIPGMRATTERRSAGAVWRPIAVVLTVVVAVLVGTAAVSLYQTARNIGSPEGRVSVQHFPVGVSFDQWSLEGLRLDVDTTWQKSWSESGGTGIAARGVVLAYAPEPEVHQCGGMASRVVVRRDPVGLLEDLGTVAGFDVGHIERRSVGGRAAASALVTGTSCGEDIHLQPIPGLVGGNNPVVLDITDPTFLTVVDVDGETVLLQLWAATEQELVQWMDEMGPLLDSISVDPHPRP